jgi:hypothetical protein
MERDESKNFHSVNRQGDEEWNKKCLNCEQQLAILSEQSGAAE